MEANIGTLDRVIRIAAGALLLVLAYTRPDYGWGWLGIYPLLTGYLRHSPIYKLLNITSCRCLRAAKR